MADSSEINALHANLTIHFPEPDKTDFEDSEARALKQPINETRLSERWIVIRDVESSAGSPAMRTGERSTTAMSPDALTDIDPQDSLHLEMSVWQPFLSVALPLMSHSPKPADDLSDDDSEMDGGVGLLEKAVGDIRNRRALNQAERRGKWRRTWANTERPDDWDTDDNPDKDTDSSSDDADSHSGNDRSSDLIKKRMSASNFRRTAPPKVLRLPPTPAPLPPCLQCVAAGACCSLTITPFAKGFINDLIDPKQRLSSTAVSVHSPLSSFSWYTSYAELTREVNETFTDWDKFADTLTERRQQLEQRFLQRAIVRGEIDSPFLPPPPVQCSRCVREGETACLQQSRDLTRPTAASQPTRVDKREVAWFASSGPPPLSLLQQHHVPILDQIRSGPVNIDKCHGGRHKRVRRRKTSELVTLEAIFCRDPTILSPSEIAVRAQVLLEKISQKYRWDAGGRISKRPQLQYLRELDEAAGKTQRRTDPAPIRPATVLEVSRLIPRRSLLNVYARRGVATATVLKACENTKLGTEQAKVAARSDHRAAPHALPSWQPKMKHAFVLQELNIDKYEIAEKAAPFKWQEQLLDVGEKRAAVKFHRERQTAKLKKQGGRGALVMSSSEAVPAPGNCSDPELDKQRNGRIAQLAAVLAGQIRAGRQKRLATGGGGPPLSLLPLPPTPVLLSPLPQANLLRQQRSWHAERIVAELTSKWTSHLDPDKAKQTASLLVGIGNSGSPDDNVDDADQIQPHVLPSRLSALARKYGVSLNRLAIKRRQWKKN